MAQVNESSMILLPFKVDETQHYDCLLTVDNKDYVLHLILPEYPSCRDCTFSVGYDLKVIIKNHEFNKTDDCQSVEKLVEEIATLIKEHNVSKPLEPGDVCDLIFTDYSQILSELSKIGWKNLESVNENFTEVQLKSFDGMNRKHILSIKLTKTVPELYVEFPGDIVFNQGSSSISELYNDFCKETEQYQEFWSAMDELDANCWILEPEKPSRKDTYRKIAVSANVSLKIVVDPKNPHLLPHITWLGSENAVYESREKVTDRIEMWESDIAIHINLERLLEVELPQKDKEQSENFDVTCCICYSDRLNGQVPSRTCDNPKCGQSFHIYCLYEWLRSLIQSRKLGNKVFGVCPYCETAISCKPPDN